MTDVLMFQNLGVFREVVTNFMQPYFSLCDDFFTENLNRIPYFKAPKMK